MSSLEDIKNKIKTTKELLTLVRTMKALAASAIRRYQKSYDSSKEYFKTVSMGFQIVIKYNHQKFITPIEQEEKIGAIILGSDLGMCGKFNDQISNFALQTMNNELKISIKNRDLITIGEHVINNFMEYPNKKKLMFPVSIDGIKKTLSLVLETIEDWIINENINQVILFYNKPYGENSYKPSMVKIFPLDEKWLEELRKQPWPNKVLPTFFMDAKELFSDLVKEYLYISLHRAFVESLLSENVSRLAAMKYAENNILDHIDELNLAYNSERQNNITEEILEIVEGYESIKNNGNEKTK
jgi:F-type H+-transporting ATPase subunit gamma